MNSDEPAYPIILPAGAVEFRSGMSLGDYFAAAALASIALHYHTENAPVAATKCYAFADAMLAERQRRAQ